MNQGGNFSPVKEGEEHNVTVEAVGEKGDGIVKIKGFVVFVPEVKQGDRVKIRITKVLSKVGFGEVIGEADTEEAPVEEVRKPKKAKQEEEIEIDTSKDSEDFGDDLEDEN